MTLNKVDLPQPEGPMTETNSPGLILNDTSSTATIGPSAVSKRTTMLSTIRMASELAGAAAAIALFALARHHRGHGGGVAGLDPYIDDRDVTGLDRGDGLRKDRREIARRVDRPKTLRALRAPDAGDVDVGLGNTLADPAVLDRAVAHAGDPLLVQFVVE